MKYHDTSFLIGSLGIASPSSPAPGSTISATRPRLVAKTLSSSRSAAPKSLNSGPQKSGTDGPDPNQVWNRNRGLPITTIVNQELTSLVQMAPQATPKHMTDEELRQQYGIQLASRPLEGADSNQAKWADLEDEDEDWAPETLEWSDGTKINLAPTEPPPPSIPPVDKSKGGREANANSAEKAMLAARTTLGSKATILKLGGIVNQPRQPIIMSGSQTSTKMSNEKPTLVAKPSPALPTKSPWAQLPPVDMVSPVGPPIQQPITRNSQREGYNRDAIPLNISHPAREIAADDYSRFSANATPRELFNSHNGRYEPVSDSRRGSGKKDTGFRAPSVLQRPSQNDMHPLNEQSPTLQSRATQDSAAWRRRRASSNVSNDSGAYGRRMSMSRPGPDGFGRRDSSYDQSIGSGPGAYPENRVSSPTISHGPSNVSQQSPVTDLAGMVSSSDRYAGTQMVGTPTTPNMVNMEHEVAQQKKLMRERAEAAIKRRKEEEAREEAEKRERLRLKLQALESTKENPAGEVPSPPVVQPNGTEAVLTVQDASKSLTPPKPPAPSLNGETQQFGLIKMHPSNHVSTNVGADGKLSQTVSSTDNSGRLESYRDQDLRQPLQSYGTIENKMQPKQATTLVNHQFEKDKSLQQSHRISGQAGSAGFQGSVWSQGSMANQPPNVNVWASPGSQKALGNGDFQKNVTQIHLPPVSSQQYPQHLASPQTQPQPIGTPRQALNNQNTIPQAAKDHLPQMQQYPSEIAPQPGHPRTHIQLPVVTKDSQPPNHLSNNINKRPIGVAAWGDFARNASVYDAQKQAQLAQEKAALAAEREKSGLPAPILRETWTQVAKGDSLGTRLTVNNSITQRDLETGEDVTAVNSQHPPTRSRYQDLFDRNERAFIDCVRPQDPLTPPPEEDDHPAFAGVAQRPKVRLPGAVFPEQENEEDGDSTNPIVRLPVFNAYNQHPLVSASQHASRSPLAPLRHQALVNNTVWQERFNGLFGGDTSLPKRSLEVLGFSTSKEPLEQVQIPRTSVSLPPSNTNIKEAIATKSVEEEVALLEEGRDFGSVPQVRIPIRVSINAWNPPRPFRDFKRIKLATLTDADVHGIPIFLPLNLHRKEENSISVRLADMTTTKLVPYISAITSRQQRPPFQGGRGNKSRNTSGQHNGQKVRDGPAIGGPSTSNTAYPTEKFRSHGTSSRKSSAHNHNGSWANPTKRHAPAPAAVH